MRWKSHAEKEQIRVKGYILKRAIDWEILNCSKVDNGGAAGEVSLFSLARDKD